MQAILLFLGVLAIIVPLSIWKGFVLSILWGWFLVPLGVPAIGTAHAIGIAVLVSMLTYQHRKSSSEVSLEPLFLSFVSPLFALAIGHIVKGFM